MEIVPTLRLKTQNGSTNVNVLVTTLEPTVKVGQTNILWFNIVFAIDITSKQEGHKWRKYIS